MLSFAPFSKLDNFKRVQAGLGQVLRHTFSIYVDSIPLPLHMGVFT